MYRELIKKYAEKNEFTVLHDPCSESDIEKTEKYVGFEFPGQLKNLLRELNGDGWLILSDKEIRENVKLNREILSEAFDSREEFEEKVNRHIFFAGNGCGDYYCFKILPDDTADESGIYIWDHEEFECRRAADDIADLINKYYNDQI